MAHDLRNVPAAALVRMINSTPLGDVITERRLYRHRQQAGARISGNDPSGRTIHLLRYAAWLMSRLARADDMGKPKAISASSRPGDALAYERHRRGAAHRQAEIAEAGQEIGTLSPVADPARRESCRADFLRYCETYHRPIFYLGWSSDHLRVIARIESAVLQGKLFALAMPRGSGKTALMLCAVQWAALYAHRRFICLIAATEKVARKLLGKIYNSLERNERLMEDFPEVCYPIRKLERTPQRAAKQKVNGAYTSMVWTKDEVVLPTIAGSISSGTIISVTGLTGGQLLGQNKDMPDGSIARPDLALIDDPQTRASAKSPTQTADRVELLQGAVLGLAGPDKSIAGLLTCTVMRPGDMADTILDRDKHPEWLGERTKLVARFPSNEKLWEEYATLYGDGLRRRDTSEATEFYRANRAAMDAGAEVAWSERFPNDCVSALQNAMNLKLRDESAFFSEYQNEPMTDQAEEPTLTADEISAKLNRRPEGSIPTSCGKLVMYVDVHKKLLYYAIVAVESDFTTYLVEYGAYPEQKAQHFLMREARRTLLSAHKGHGEEAAIYAGLETLCNEKIGKAWTRDDGALMRISLCLIDSGYQKNTVELFAKQSAHASVVLPAKGLPVSASSIPLDERARKKGEEVGDNWRITGSQGEYSTRLVLIDVNHWKSFLQARLAVPIGDAGCLSLWGRSQTRHRMLAEHLASETRIRTEGRGRKLDEWRLPPHKPDNHLLDCCVGCQAAASMLGARLLGKLLPREKPRRTARKKARYF